MKKFSGISVSSGIGIGIAKIIKPKQFVINTKKLDLSQVESELIRFEKSLNYVLSDIDRLIENFSHNKNNKKILTTHKMILNDPDFISKVNQMIGKDLICLEKAIDLHFNEVIEIFSKMDNQYIAERSNDFKDVADRLLSHLTKQNNDISDKLDPNAILIMQEVTPSQVAKVFYNEVKGIITEKGSKTAHSSIIARSIGLPMIVGIDKVCQQISDGAVLIIDGYKGEIIIDPTTELIEEYEVLYQDDLKNLELLEKLIDLPVQTSDGKNIILKCNIEIPEEMVQVMKLNSDGIGLLRTEFMFIDRTDLPNETEQYEIYKKIAVQMGKKQLILRTIDVGGDKLSDILNMTKELNPNLGCRGIRMSLLYPEIFKVQLRSILKASLFGNIALMFPMVSSIYEFDQAYEILEQCKAELIEEDIEFNHNIKIGIMIEVPSAAINSGAFAQKCDFFSIGTNDLVQYALAVDRGNEHVADYYQPLNPAVLKLLEMTLESGRQNNINVSICGEMASELDYIELLIGLDVKELSVSPGRFLAVKNRIMQINSVKAEIIAQAALMASSTKEVIKIIHNK